MVTEAVHIHFSTQFEGPEAVLPPSQAPKSQKKFHEHLSAQDHNVLVAFSSFCQRSLHSPKIWRCRHIETHSLFPTSNHHRSIVPILPCCLKSVGMSRILSWADIEETASRPSRPLKATDCRFGRHMRIVLRHSHRRGRVRLLTSALQDLCRHPEKHRPCVSPSDLTLLNAF